MNKTKLMGWVVVGLTGMVSATAATASEFPNDDWDPRSILSDSGIEGPPYEQIVGELASLEAAHPSLAKRIVYGLTHEGRPLNLIRIGKPTFNPTAQGRRAVLIAGSIHGDEYLNIEDRLPRWFLEKGIGRVPSIDQFFDAGGVLYIAPILNPDGYAKDQRWNAAFTDLNRDFTIVRENYKGFQQPETRGLSEYLEKDLRETGLRLAMTLDYHCCQGSLLYPWSFDAENIPQVALDQHILGGKIMHSTVNSTYRVGRAPELLGYEAVGTSKDHYYEKYGSVSYTFEGARRVENKNFEKHTAMWIRFFEEIVLK